MISSKCLYALLALLELAQHEESTPVTISQIARSQQIPSRFLEAILRELKQGGFTTSHRGKDGGYLLSRDATGIRVGDVIRHIEGPLKGKERSALTGITESSKTVFGELMDEASDALASVYDRKTIKDLARRDAEIRERHVINYSI
jgi:Rrf2 family protein